MKLNVISRTGLLARLLLFVVVAMLAGMPGGARAQEDEPQVTWQEYDVVVQVNEDGTLRVTETILIEFHDSFRQGERSIPMDRIEEIDGVTVSVGRSAGEMERASEPTVFLGDPGTFGVSYGDDEVVIAYGFERTSTDESDSVRAVEISYTAHGAIRDYPDAEPAEQQVRWTAVSGEITETGPVESASATVIFPEAMAQEELAIDPEPTSVEPDRVVWERDGLASGESLQVAVAFPPVTEATAPAWQADADTYEGRQEHLPAINSLIAMVALVTWVVMLLYMVVRGVRDPEVGLIADIIPNRPDDMPAPLVGTLVDEMVDTKDVLAGVLDLDRQGIITIRDEPTGKKGKVEYQAVLNRPIDEAAAWERPTLEGLFGKDAEAGKEIDFVKQMKKVRESSWSGITSAYDDELFARGFYIEHPSKTRVRWGLRVAGLFALFILLLAIPMIWARMFTLWALPAAVVSFFGLIAGLIMLTKIAVKTTEGAVEAAKWKAYGRYLKELRTGPNPERFLETIEYDLPWAVALGFDSSWSKLADDMSAPTSARNRGDRRYHTTTPVFVGGVGGGSRQEASSGSGGGSFSGGLQGASGKALSAIGGGSAGMFAMLNDAAASVTAGSSSGSSSGGFSGSSSVGSSGGGGHSFS